MAAPLKQPKPETLVERIERQTGKHIGIETSLNDDSLSKCNPQTGSPLFGLPMEIRTLIFEFAATQSNELERYEEKAYYYRPGHIARHRTYTAFLLTCRRLWLEANAMPMRMAEHSFWFQRGPYDQRSDAGWAANLRLENDRYTRLLRSLTTCNLQNLTHIHLFMQMFQAQEFRQSHKMEHFLPYHYLLHGLRPRIFHVTIRQSDWWDWEHDAVLNLDRLTLKDEGRWVQSILDAPQLGGTQKFVLELETVESKVGQLERIVEGLQRLEGQPIFIDSTDVINPQRSKFVCTEPPQRWQWTRSTSVGGGSFDIFRDLKELKLHVVVLEWRKKPCNPTNRTREIFGVAENSRTPRLSLNTPIPSVSGTFTYTPVMIMRSRARRALINEMAWNRTASFDQYANVIRDRSNEQASKVENGRRECYAKLIGDMVAKDNMLRWMREGSLLRFVDP